LCQGFVKALAIVGVVTNKSMALCFVGEKHKRRRPICLHHGLIGLMGFCGFLGFFGCGNRRGELQFAPTSVNSGQD
jgi:hypothetical protein